MKSFSLSLFLGSLSLLLARSAFQATVRLSFILPSLFSSFAAPSPFPFLSALFRRLQLQRHLEGSRELRRRSPPQRRLVFEDGLREEGVAEAEVFGLRRGRERGRRRGRIGGRMRASPRAFGRGRGREPPVPIVSLRVVEDEPKAVLSYCRRRMSTIIRPTKREREQRKRDIFKKMKKQGH